ncbi:MAG: hypothetical protein K0Q91_1633 [Fibrobacteria bacterium]|nr:hypothetical protein [Fibrobacteria bacterium]
MQSILDPAATRFRFNQVDGARTIQGKHRALQPAPDAFPGPKNILTQLEDSLEDPHTIRLLEG